MAVKALKVFMMGGPRVGKTSVLAGLVDTMLNGEVSRLLSVKDVTVLEEGSESLADKVESLKQNLRVQQGKVFLVDDTKTKVFQDYVLEFTIPGTNNTMSMKFCDANGEFYEQGRRHEAEIREIMSSYDVFVIAIDTPALMESAKPNNRLCNEAVNRAINFVDDIQSFVTSIDDKEGADAKLVLFVPLKCEKWAKENRLGEVSQRVKSVYGTCINNLSSLKNVEVCIFPIQTAGNIVFVEHQKAMLCSHKGQPARACSMIDNKTRVRFYDGEVRPIDPANDKIAANPQAVIKEGLSLMRPYAWFKTISETYSPHNCDQLAYYVIQFMFAKVNLAKQLEQNNANFKRKVIKIILTGVAAVLGGIPAALIAYYSYKYFMERFGSMTYKQIESLMNDFKEKNIVRRNGDDGVVVIKKSLLEL